MARVPWGGGGVAESSCRGLHKVLTASESSYLFGSA